MYLLFAGDTYYAKGGFHDYKGIYGSVGSAQKAYSDLEENDPYNYEWYHVVDANTFEIVDKSETQPHGVDDD
jgi:hypothetical protein